MRRPVKGYHQSTEIRRSYEILPFQGVWTWLTGKELPERKPLWRNSSTEMVMWSLSWVALGVALTTLSVMHVQNTAGQILCWLAGALFFRLRSPLHRGDHYPSWRSRSPV